MPFRIDYVDDGRGAIVQFSGHVTELEFEQILQDLTTPPEKILQYRFALFDYTEAADIKASTDWIIRMAEGTQAFAQLNPDAIAAFVLPGAYQYGLGRMWQAYTSDSGRVQEIFRSRQAAENWIREKLGPETVFE